MVHLDRITDWIADQSWLGPAEAPVQDFIASLYRAGGETGMKIKDFWNGVWLGHPLHPMITDIPIGAWSAAVTMDALDTQRSSRKMQVGADTAIAVGMAGAIGSVVAGATDWQYLTGRPRRIGLVHAGLNVTALLLFALSMIFRAGRQRQAGKSLALAGFSALLLAGYLGGDLSYREKVGVNHAPLPDDLPHTYKAVMPASELPENQLKRAFIDGISIVLVKRGEQIYALAETCAHLGGPLAEGEFHADDVSVTCPWHGSRFRFADGSIVNGPATYFQPCLQTRVRDGQIEVMLPEPGSAHTGSPV